MSKDIEPFLKQNKKPVPDTDNQEEMKNQPAQAAHERIQRTAEIFDALHQQLHQWNDPHLSDETLEALRYACLDDATKTRDYFSPLLEEQIAQQAKRIEQQDEQLRQLQKISDASHEEVAVMKEQLEFTKRQAEEAKEDAKFSRRTSIAAIIISLLALFKEFIFMFIEKMLLYL